RFRNESCALVSKTPIRPFKRGARDLRKRFSVSVSVILAAVEGCGTPADASYVALAEGLGIWLITLDRAILEAHPASRDRPARTRRRPLGSTRHSARRSASTGGRRDRDPASARCSV